ncbi:MAG: ATP-dependent DNA helicase RecG [Pirellulaceae bacterium]
MGDKRPLSPAEQLLTPVQYLTGVGPQRAALLHRLGLKTAADLLFFFPRSYHDMSELLAIEQLEDNVAVSICGVIDEVELHNTGTGRSILGMLVRQGTQFLRAVWFNQPYMQDKLPVGRRVMLSGTPKRRGFRWEMAHPKVELLDDDDPPPQGRILPAYGLTEGINQSLMRRIAHSAVDKYAEMVEEVFPEGYREQHVLTSIQTALRNIHTPPGRQELEQARHRFIYQELLVMQLALALRRWKLRHERRAPSLPATTKIDARITRLFPFELTADQQRAIREISQDMEREFPMNRLLHGEVGSGKTVVAEYAMLSAVAHGYQAVLMAPTEVLARQHARTLERDLHQSHVRIALLTGTLTAAQRRETLSAIRAGEVDLVVGTHAVIQADVQFSRLGLVVIDEQHRFGVRQRETLKRAGLDPHYLVMTATPIPRTVSMTLFGDLDLSTLRENPPGRQAVHTYLGDESKRARWWRFYRKKLREGRQGYVIAPLVEESSEVELASVQQAFEQLANGELEAFRLDLIHGRLSSREKDAVMQAFRSGDVQVLVATSVVEVGVDVPNATLMTIENGERFGLAQLHQLRGRVSRGVFPGYVCVFAEPATEDASRRLDSFCQLQDGFELAEIDFSLRGPGDLLGPQQHGLPRLRIADLRRDADTIQHARADARALIASDPALDQPGFERLRRMVHVRYGKALEIGDVG